MALVFYFINLILQFFSRKIFLDYLGAEVLGLNTTATNLLQFLNLAELGVGAAIACTLYKPLAEKDTDTINEIVSLQGWLYRRIAWIVIAGSVVLMAFFPWIFAKMPLPLWYAYASFGVLLVSGLLSYFVNYKQIVLSADQKEAYAYHKGNGILAKIQGKNAINTRLPTITIHAIRRYNQPCKETISLIATVSFSNKGLYNVQAMADPIPNSARFKNCSKLVAVVFSPKISAPR